MREGGRPVVRARLLAGGPGDYEDGDDSGAGGGAMLVGSRAI